MSFAPKPCTHCGGTSLHVLPNIQLEHGHEPASSWPKHHRDPANRGAE